MLNKNLLKKLNMLGFPLFETEQLEDANATLAEVVTSREPRFLEGFPVVLANSAEKGLFDFNELRKYLKKPSDKFCLDALMIMSLALYSVCNLKFSWADKFCKSLSAEQKKKFKDVVAKLKRNENFKVGDQDMSPQRLKSTFANYFNQTQNSLNDLFSLKREFNLEYSLSQVFSPKQKELFLKKLRGEKLTKTEKEYFSRVVKKKVLALANPELHRLSQQVLK